MRLDDTHNLRLCQLVYRNKVAISSVLVRHEQFQVGRRRRSRAQTPQN